MLKSRCSSPSFGGTYLSPYGGTRCQDAQAGLQSVCMRGGILLRLAALVIVGGSLVVGSAPVGAQSSPPVSTIRLQSPTAYTPHPPNGGTDDYHCTLVNPHVNDNSFIVSSEFFPNSVEVHHAILFLVPPALAVQAKAADVGGKGWTCFGETALPGATLGHLGETPWLSAWAPGHGEDVLPHGVGQPLPKGSLVVMQIHYNLLLGDKPVRAKLVLHTVPASTPLRPMSLALMPAPPDIPCPAEVTGPLCTRTASLADLGQRFGQGSWTPLRRCAGAARSTPQPAIRPRAPGRSCKLAPSCGRVRTCICSGRACRSF
jgi:hypothetical protein